jgi:hypothetical protein
MAALVKEAWIGGESVMAASAPRGLDPCNNSSGANGALALAAAYRSWSRQTIKARVSLFDASWYCQPERRRV